MSLEQTLQNNSNGELSLRIIDFLPVIGYFNYNNRVKQHIDPSKYNSVVERNQAILVATYTIMGLAALFVHVYNLTSK